jgi:hypothetical protein
MGPRLRGGDGVVGAGELRRTRACCAMDPGHEARDDNGGVVRAVGQTLKRHPGVRSFRILSASANGLAIAQ